MKSEKTFVFFRILAIAAAMQFGIFASSAQTYQFLYTGSETTINLNPGTYDITAYGAQGGGGSDGVLGGLGAEMDSQFDFTGVTTLTILVGGTGGSPNPTVGGGGGGGGYSGGGGSDFSGAGGGGSYVAPSAIKVLAEVSGVPSPDDSPNGEIMITESPEPTTLALAGLSGLFLMLFRRQRSWVNP
jgi:hypothetical protein